MWDLIIYIQPNSPLNLADDPSEKEDRNGPGSPREGGTGITGLSWPQNPSPFPIPSQKTMLEED